MINTIPLATLKTIQPLSFEENKKRILEFMNEINPEIVIYETSDEMVMLEAFAYELTYRDNAINQRFRNILPTFATGENLDLACMNFYGTTRLSDESDKAFLERSLLSLQQSSTAGAEWSYIYHTKSVDSRIVDVLPWRVSAGIVNVTWYANETNIDELNAIETAITQRLTDVKIKPIGDNTHYVGDEELHINRAVEVNFSIDATIRVHLGIDGDVAKAEALANLNTYLLSLSIGQDIKTSKLISVLDANGVDEVVINAPLNNIAIDKYSIAKLLNINIVTEVLIDE